MRIIKPHNFDAYVENFCLRKKDFVIETKRNTNSMYVDNKLSFIGKMKKQGIEKKENRKSIISLFAQVQKSVNKFIVDANFDIEKVEDNFKSTKTNKDKWNRIENGEVFWYIDINHCYWRIAFLKGYISEKLYKNTLAKSDLKIERNMSLAMIFAPKKRKYYIQGEFVVEISEEKTLWRTLYNNIRFTAYNLMGECMELSGDSFISYRTDGIMVTEDVVNDVSELISDKNFEYTIEKCIKLNNKSYQDEEGDIIKF